MLSADRFGQSRDGRDGSILTTQTLAHEQNDDEERSEFFVMIRPADGFSHCFRIHFFGACELPYRLIP